MRSIDGERGALRLPRSRGARETLIALLALPVLLLVGVQVGEQLRGDPATPAAAPVTSPPAASPYVTSLPKPSAPPRVTSPTSRPPVRASPTAPRATRPSAARPPAARPPTGAGRSTGDAEPPPPADALSIGTAGAQVRQWQHRMAERGWRIAVDGIYGPHSAAVARQFQAEKGLAVDGLVGSKTWRATWRLPVTP